MLITFRSKQSADIQMLDKHALMVMEAMGRQYEEMPAQGVITAEQLPEAIKSLEHAMKKDKQESPSADDIEKENERRKEKGLEPIHTIDQYVGLPQRAYPVLRMMLEAEKHQDNVVWQAGSAW